MPSRGGAWQGMNWCHRPTRLAIYIRDGFACVWCGWAVEDGASLCLDHLTPHSRGGTNAHTNLVTACKRCNDTRGAKPVTVWAARHGLDPRRVRRAARRPLDRAAARAMLAARTVAQVLNERRKVA